MKTWVISISVFLLTCAASAVVVAGTWRANTGADLSVDFTDNVFLSEDEQQSDTLLILTPRLSLSHNGSRRFSSSITYTPSIRYSLQGVRDNEIAHFLNADADVIVLRNIFGVRARASARQRLIDRNAAFTDDGLTNPDNITNTYSIEIVPYSFPTKLGRFAVLAMDFGADLVINEQGANSSGNFVNIGLTSGSIFTRWRWGLSYNRDFTQSDQDSDDGSTLRNLEANARYFIDRTWSVSGSIGYDDLQANTLRDVDGLTWRTGLGWNPSPRSSFNLSYGERFSGRNFQFDFHHRHRRLSWQASLQRSITTANNEFLNRNIFPTIDGNGDPIEDPTQDPDATEILPGPTLDETLFILDSLNLSTGWAMNRTNLSLGLNYSQRDSLVDDLITNDLVFSLGMGRKLTPRSTASITATWIKHSEDDNDDAEFEQWSGSLSYSNSLSNYFRFSIQYLLSVRDALTGADFTENRIGMGLSTRLR